MKHTNANPTPMSIFKNLADKSLRLMGSLSTGISSTTCWWRVSPERRDTTTVMNEHAKQGEKVLSLFHVSHQWTLQGVFIGGVMPPMYHYSFTPLQRSYSLNIPGRTRDFPITVWVRYSSERPTTPGGPLHPGRRRPRGLLTTPYHDASVARSSPIFTFRPEE